MIFEVLLILVLLFISLGTYIYIELECNKYKKVKVKSNLSGFEVSRKLLDSYDLNNIYITETKEFLQSKYDPDRKVVRLIKSIFDDDSITSCVISSIESGYAVLDNKKNNSIYNFRKKMNSFINVLLIFSYIIILVGIFFGHSNTLMSGIIIDYVILLYYVFTINVEKEIKKIVIKNLISNKIVTKKELIHIERLSKIIVLKNIASIILPIIELIKKIINFGKSNQ